ncbi:OsmC family protein [Congregibacter brevis]|uniref:OsmC family protein n=1 Tax=Congregibacter brevis TaxID=3081201 RepID=A0ABZ0IGY3_9GAMM|nr:OsmC family protein [Congregibacter sp. IMCC45268]
MQDFPHHYQVNGSATADSPVILTAENVSEIVTAPPAEFGGPGDKWSPESLLVAAVADCFILSFRAIARASKLEWSDLQCKASGTLDRVERVTRFTGINVEATLSIPAGTDIEKAEKLLHKAEQSCLITNSLIAESTLSTNIAVDD